MPFTTGAKSAKPGCGPKDSRNRTQSNGRPLSLRMWPSWSGREISDGAGVDGEPISVDVAFVHVGEVTVSQGDTGRTIAPSLLTA